jgi:hypothetical protein
MPRHLHQKIAYMEETSSMSVSPHAGSSGFQLKGYSKAVDKFVTVPAKKQTTWQKDDLKLAYSLTFFVPLSSHIII